MAEWIFRGFLCLGRRIFSPRFCGKKCSEKSSRKIPGKILQNLHNKNPRHISAEGPGQEFVPICSDLFRFALLVFGNTLICSDLLRFLPICFQNKAGKPLSADPFCKSPNKGDSTTEPRRLRESFCESGEGVRLPRDRG